LREILFIIRNAIRKLWTKYLAEAHLPTDTWFHDNRRAYITNCRRRGIDERTIMRQSGHKTRSAFDRYNIVDDNDQRAAVRQYEAALSGHALDTPPSEADSGKTKAPDFSRAFG
jgi:integrase